jgi:hypothetical protein
MPAILIHKQIRRPQEQQQQAGEVAGGFSLGKTRLWLRKQQLPVGNSADAHGLSS